MSCHVKLDHLRVVQAYMQPQVLRYRLLSRVKLDDIYDVGCRPSDTFSAYKLRQGKWVPVQLRLSSFAIDRVDGRGAAARISCPDCRAVCSMSSKLLTPLHER